MKAYLTGPRLKQTVNIKGVEFVNGVADLNKESVYLERYYGVVYVKPAEYEEELKQTIEEDPIDVYEEQKVLYEAIEERKRAIENNIITKVEEKDTRPPEEQLKDFKNFGEMVKYVKEKTGFAPRSKAKAIELLREYG